MWVQIQTWAYLGCYFKDLSVKSDIFFSRFAKKIFSFDYRSRTLPHFLANIYFPKPPKRCHYLMEFEAVKSRFIVTPEKTSFAVIILNAGRDTCGRLILLWISKLTDAVHLAPLQVIGMIANHYISACNSHCAILLGLFFSNHIFGRITITFWIIWWCSEKLRCIRNISTNNNGRSG